MIEPRRIDTLSAIGARHHPSIWGAQHHFEMCVGQTLTLQSALPPLRELNQVFSRTQTSAAFRLQMSAKSEPHAMRRVRPEFDVSRWEKTALPSRVAPLLRSREAGALSSRIQVSSLVERLTVGGTEKSLVRSSRVQVSPGSDWSTAGIIGAPLSGSSRDHVLPCDHVSSNSC